MGRRLLGTVFVGALVGACATPPPGSGAVWTVRFGPVIGAESIVGRVQQGRRIWLATQDAHLVRVDVDGHRHARHPIGPLATRERIWGLAATEATGLWTLVGFNTLAQVTPAGRIARRVPLAEPHSNVVSGQGDLLYQLVAFQPGAEAIQAGPPGDAARRPWGAMRMRELALPRAEAALMNIVSCGPAGPAGVPCWYPDSPVLTLTTASGRTGEITLAGVIPARPETLLSGSETRRPILDVAQAPGGGLWVLSAGEVVNRELADRRGGWLLGHYAEDGSLVTKIQLPEPARLLLGVTDASCLLLSWSGHVVEVATAPIPVK
jgi:hypothetical protein